MRKFWPLLIFLSFLVNGCLYQRQAPPDYMVMLTGLYPDSQNRCTGALYDPWTILTVAHCANSNDLGRAVTQNGQQATYHALAVWVREDFALLRLDHPLFTTEYANLGAPDVRKTAFIYGTCPLYFPQNPKPATYVGIEHVGQIRPYRDYDHWHTLNEMVCGGDSGGFAVQDGKIVGFTSAVESDNPFISLGTEVYLVPVEYIRGLLMQYANGLYLN